VHRNIPIRRSSAFRGINLEDPRDALFAVEMGKVSTAYHLAPPYPGGLVTDGISKLLETGADLETGLAELAQLARTTLGIQGLMKKSPDARTVFAR
jgi:hypothetical protein